ncbi:LuxR C-terminal-related transcriptional regulator [Amycolatopsis acidiphila]|uniref:LuxR C-terminal-related transcriptional regulator n=1 Tax=Amycolatopsis acidiphila TaxID=715473 RepID=UPI001643BDEC|nr:LuxR C-terminal-related transcriptional regulator [Amycolatopsis acidiphila]UIJ63396.1 LuxR C-terminal-related transcriptional regulator [Amycolatopsis acidiphila]GHG75385.1 LuxR family transcriptional regulator [Amycolatopsis acidiphila]
MPRAKVVVPGVPPGYVSRPRLLSALDQARDATAIVVCAPAGSGKTLLLAEWVRLRHAAETAWVSLDSDDNDDRRFWSGILKALEACPGVPPDSPLRHLAVPVHPSRHLGFTGAVVNALDELPRPVWLVLDDLHEIVGDAPLQGLETLLRQHASALRLVLIARHDPPLSLAKLRLADQLAEIRTDDLRFSGPEAHALLAAAGVELSPEQLAELVQRTEGWAAGLRLATVSLRETEDPGRFLAEFAENDRAMADYLLDEVLSRLPPDLLEFLRAISVCDEVSAGLARTLSGRGDAGVLLDTLERATSLVMRVGARQRWYRVHALVRSYLLAGLNRQLPGQAVVLHQHAADWFARHGRPVQALAQLIQTRDADHVVASLRRSALPLALAGAHDLLARALAVLGENVIAADSLLALVSASLQLEEGEAAGAEVDLAHAEAAWAVPAPAELEQLHVLVKVRLAELTGDIDAMLHTTDELELGEASHILGALSMLRRGNALLAAGRHNAAHKQLEAALDAARENEQDYVATQCLAALAGVAATVGDYRLMGRLAGDALREAEDKGWRHTMVAATASAVLGYRDLLLGRPAECLRHAQDATQLVDGDVPSANRGLSVLLGALAGTARFEVGEWAEGLAQLGAARAGARGIHLPAPQVVLGAVLEHRAAVRFGWTEAAREAVTWVREAAPECGELMLMRARSQLALGRPVSAGALIRAMLDASHTMLLPWTAIDAWLLDTEVALFADDEPGAQRALHKALSLAGHMDVLYPLVFASPVVIELLISRLGKLGGLHSVAAQVLEVRQALGVPVIPLPLTRRERTVLNLLPTLRSFDEIAQDLTISPNTVKTHVRAIYHKLGVRRRRDAVSVALERGLLESAAEVTNGPGPH